MRRNEKKDPAWLESRGWHVTFSREMAARITLMYAQCERRA
jgi:hypothetical protein